MATKTAAKPAAKAAPKAAAKPAAKPAAKAAVKPAAKTTAKAAPKAAPAEKEVKEVHELAWTEGKGWAVKRQGSDKVIKYFKTKVEGTEYIVKVAGNQGTRVVIKLKNGKYQKFDNAMRALSYAKETKDPD